MLNKNKHIFILGCLYTNVYIYFFSLALQPSAVLTTYNKAPQSVGFLWTNDKPVAENADNTQQTNIHAPGGIRTTIAAGERPWTYALDRAATGTGTNVY
jgi:hypothetical protein